MGCPNCGTSVEARDESLQGLCPKCVLGFVIEGPEGADSMVGRELGDYMIVGKAAAYLSVSKTSLRRWDRAGKLKACRHPINGYRLHQKSDLDELLREFGFEDAPPRRTDGTKKQSERKRSR